MKVCLIIPPSGFLMDERVFPSLGILKVAAVLEHAGVDVSVFDLSGKGVSIDDLPTANAYGITATMPQMPAAAEIARLIRAEHPTVRLILGGPHPTLMHSSAKHGSERAKTAMLDLFNLFDVIVSGDGEKTIGLALAEYPPQLIDADDPGCDLFLTKQDLNEAPFAARHLIDIDSYHYEIDGVKTQSVIFQLGCPFGCNFCGGRRSPFLRRVRTRSSERVIAELRHLYDRYGTRGFMCYDDATDILTRARGWVKFGDLDPTDEVAILHHSSGELRFEIPKRIVRKQFEGDLVTVKSKFVDLAVTPEHRMWVKPKGEAAFIHQAASDMVHDPRAKPQFYQRSEWVGKYHATFSIPAYEVRYLGRRLGSPKVHSGDRVFPAALWVQFMAWYLSEGSCYRPKIVKGGRGYRICIKQSHSANPSKVAEIGAILAALGYRHSYSSNQFHIDSRELYEYLHQFGGSYEKYVPQEFKEMSSELMLLFLKTYIKGDGTRSAQGQEQIMSVSGRMRDDLQEIAIKSGYWAALDSRDRVLLSRQREPVVNDQRKGAKTAFGKRRYKGVVHCVTVSTGVVLVRRNGRAVWCGNCLDDELNVNTSFMELLRQIVDLQDELGVEFRLRGLVKSELMTEPMAKAMYHAGFRQLLIGFESGDPRMLANMNKHATREDNTRCVQILKAAGIKVKALMSVGHPGESPESIQATKDWLLEVRPDDFDVTVITVYPGTPYYEDAVQIGHSEEYVYTAKNGDRLYSLNTDHIRDVNFYKGSPGAYQSFVWTDTLSREAICAQRDAVETDVRKALGIPWPTSAAERQFEHSMGSR